MKGEKMRREGLMIFILLFMSLVFEFQMPGVVQAREGKEIKEILIKVQPRIIALPENEEITKVPLSAARIRSTELRELNKKYNAVMIERLYKLKDKIKNKDIEVGGVFRSEENVEPPVVDMSKIFTKKRKEELEKNNKELTAQGKEVASVNDTFLIQFDASTNVDMNKVAAEYKALDVVTFAEYVVREE